MLGTEALDVTQGERGRKRMGLPALGGAERISVLDRSMCYYINEGKADTKALGSRSIVCHVIIRSPENQIFVISARDACAHLFYSLQQ